ncbi:hypothetical protein FGO68_gene8459 [Halteria grandinella]|uniref:EamA domain-containing protein n=1 Tax=Halteria grandinella TaxID=5974 RepID=A0A8J8NMQ2_HALGN|nr:hypothetical protein FGO68_gene8459 [Halteria grandinella]
MYDTIPRAQYWTLFFRCVQGGFGFMCLYTCIKYFPLVFVSLVQNIAPLLIALFSYYFYAVGLSRHDMIILMLSFIGVIVLITGSLDSNEESDTTEGDYSTSQLIIPALCLIVIPFNTATVRLFMRSLKDLNELTLGALIVTAMLILYLPIVVIFYGFDYLDTFDNTDWGICVLLGFTSSTLQVLMAKSIQYEEPARLAVLNYFQPIIQLILDVIFLHNIFTGQQMLGAGIIFVANSASWVFKVQKAFFSEKKMVEAPGNTQVDEEVKSSRQKD